VTDKPTPADAKAAWRRFVRIYLGVFAGGAVLLFLFIALLDPYDDVGFSLPLERRIVSISQRHVYPQIVRSRRFDSLIIGTSTGRLLDPDLLNESFGARFANLAMDSATAWEQKTMLELFLREVGPPKALIVALDVVWCSADAARQRITFRGFPDWLYDSNPWNDYLYLFNLPTLEIAGRLMGYQLGLYPERVRHDGYQVFVPPETEYDLTQARRHIWGHRTPQLPPDLAPPPLSPGERQALTFPALAWLDEGLAAMPASSIKILAFMPVHVAAQPWPGTREAAIEGECKARIAQIARARGATVIDWRIASPLTSNDANYWDNLHYRVPIATHLARQLGALAAGKNTEDGTYRLTVR
jgi:hypothetical protein